MVWLLLGLVVVYEGHCDTVSLPSYHSSRVNYIKIMHLPSGAENLYARKIKSQDFNNLRTLY